MSFDPGNAGANDPTLVERYQEICRNRRVRDSIWDFLHAEDSNKPPTWIKDCIALVRSDLTDDLSDKFAELLDFLECPRWTYLHYAAWFTCVTIYPDMRDFLIFHPAVERCNQDMVASFIDKVLPKLVHNWLTGHYALVESFVMHVRAEYVYSVPCAV